MKDIVILSSSYPPLIQASTEEMKGGFHADILERQR